MQRAGLSRFQVSGVRTQVADRSALSADRIAAAINNISGSFKTGTPKEVE
jgi:hypothetical protein